MRRYLLLLCFMISLGRGQDDPLSEEGPPVIHLEQEPLKNPEDSQNLLSAKRAGIPWPYVGDRCCNLSTTSKCLKKGGECMPRNETCLGQVHSGPSFCDFNKIKSCKCCVPAECKTLSPCKAMNGTCNVACEGKSVSGKDFCKDHEFCKCCLPDDRVPENCPCGQDYNGGCMGYDTTGLTSGHCMKNCKDGTVLLKQHTCNQTGGEECQCCAPKPVACGPTCVGPIVQSCTCIENGETCPDDGSCSVEMYLDGGTTDAVNITAVMGALIDIGTCHVHENGSHNIGCVCCRDGLKTECKSKHALCSNPGDFCIDKYSSPCPEGFEKAIDACYKGNSKPHVECDCCKKIDSSGSHEIDIVSVGGIARASSSHISGNREPMKAFDGSGFWHSGGSYDPDDLYAVPQSLWAEYPIPFKVVRYSFTSRTDTPGHYYTATDGPSMYIFWASNDADCTKENHWVILKEDNSGTPFSNNNTPKEEIIENSNFYRCYGFKVTDVPGRHGIKPVTIANVHFYTSQG